jgi:hypothetical protein
MASQAENAEKWRIIGTQMNTDLSDQKKENPRLSAQIRVRFLFFLCAFLSCRSQAKADAGSA